MDAPSAPHYILAEACHAARRYASNDTREEVVKGGDHLRCLLPPFTGRGGVGGWHRVKA